MVLFVIETKGNALRPRNKEKVVGKKLKEPPTWAAHWSMKRWDAHEKAIDC